MPGLGMGGEGMSNDTHPAWTARPAASRRQFLTRAGALMAATALPVSAMQLVAACGGSSAPQNTAAGPTTGGHLVTGLSADARNLIPSMTADVLSQSISNLMFTPPVWGYLDGSYGPALAEAMPKAGADKKTFTFKLRSGLRWNDGTPITADDVVFTYRLLYDPAYAQVNSPFRSQWVSNVASVTALDNHTVQLKTKEVYALYLDLFSSYPIVPKHVLGTLSPSDINTTPFRQAPNVSYGPFRFERWDKGSQIVLDRQPGYSLSPTHVDRIVYRVFGDITGVANGLRTGEVDFGGVDLSLVDSLRQPNIDVITLPSVGTYYVAFQMDPSKSGSKFFGDKRVRQAMAYGVDRKKILQAVLFGYGTINHSVVPVYSWGHDAGVTPAYDYDPRKAAQLLDAAGWSMGSSQVREKGGQPFSFDLMYILGDPATTGFVEALQAQWKTLGVNVTLKGLAEAQAVNILSTTRDFDALFVEFSFSQDPEYPFSLLFSSAARQTGGFNICGYVNPEIDAGLAQGSQLLDRSQRKPIYNRLQQILAQDVPMVPLLAPKVLYAARTRVRDAVYHETIELSRVYVTDRK